MVIETKDMSKPQIKRSGYDGGVQKVEGEGSEDQAEGRR